MSLIIKYVFTAVQGMQAFKNNLELTEFFYQFVKTFSLTIFTDLKWCYASKTRKLI